MLRFLLLVAPFTLIASITASALMIPITWLLRDIRPIYAVGRWVVRATMWLAGVRIEVRGSDPWRAPQPCIYLGNHTSNLDPPVAFLCLPRIAIMGKAVVFRWPFFGYAMKMAGFIPVDRGRTDSRRRALEAGIDRLRRGISLLIFPEGTRSLDGKLLPFRPGPFSMAIQAQAHVVPMTILGSHEVMPKGRFWTRPGRIQVIFHQPISTSGLTQQDREMLARQVRDAIASALPQQPGS